MSGFSGAIKIGDMNDYIAPSQSCVVSLKGGESKAQLVLEDDVELQVRTPANAPRKDTAEGPVKINLHDCLACSGCVTSAETVLLEQQSTDEFLAKLKDDVAVIVSVSPQSRAALAAQYKTTPLQTAQKVTGFLKSLGVRAVFDTSCARDLALLEAAEEFVARYRATQVPAAADEAPSTSAGLEAGPAPGPLPMLASACPGWVCYAEKTHGSYVLPHISTAKSPQQVMGTLVKRHVARRLGVRAQQVYHVSIMPCYDKKLEASREDFLLDPALEGPSGLPPHGDRAALAAETDCVLTTGELHQLMRDRQVEFGSLECSAGMDSVLGPAGGAGAPPEEQRHLYGAGAESGSGGYLDFIFRYASKHLFGQEELAAGTVELKQLRNADFRECCLEVEGKVVLRCAMVYGFRNIQNLLRKIKAKRSEYHFVEIMACPSGCLNGGGQIKPATGQSAKELLEEVQAMYHHPQVEARSPSLNPVVQSLYADWLGEPYSSKARALLHTQYHQREKTVTTMISNW